MRKTPLHGVKLVGDGKPPPPFGSVGRGGQGGGQGRRDSPLFHRRYNFIGVGGFVELGVMAPPSRLTLTECTPLHRGYRFFHVGGASRAGHPGNIEFLFHKTPPYAPYCTANI
jgi:hypothetical protein